MSDAAKLFQSALLVEDEPNLVTGLKVALRKLGIPSSHAITIEQAEKSLEISTPELILLDRNLPDGDGLSLCARLRARGYQGMILVLTARGEVEERVKGLEKGADDYLPKPFAWTELEARIKTLARRKPHHASSAGATPSAEGSLWRLDSERLRILGQKGWVELTPLEFKLAERLMQAEGAIVTRDDLLKNVWGFTLLPKTRTVDHFLGRLRKHFEANPDEPRHFITVRGAGYRFER